MRGPGLLGFWYVVFSFCFVGFFFLCLFSFHINFQRKWKQWAFVLRVSSVFQYSVQHVLNSFIFTVEQNSSIVDCLNSCTCRIYACLVSSETRSIMFSSFFPLLLHCLADRTGLRFWPQWLVILLCTISSVFFLLPPHQSPESEIWNPKPKSSLG